MLINPREAMQCDNSYFKIQKYGLVTAINPSHSDSEQNIFWLYSAPTCSNKRTTNESLIFGADGTRSASPHRALVFYLWMKHFVGNVSRQASGALSVPMYIPIMQRHLDKEIRIEESVISCHISHNVLEASSKDCVGVGVGGMETSLIWSPWSTLIAETSTRDPHRVPASLSKFWKALKQADGGGPCEADIYMAKHQRQPFSSFSPLSIPLHLLTFRLNRWQDSISAYVSCLLHGIAEKQPVHRVCFYIIIQIALYACLWIAAR